MAQLTVRVNGRDYQIACDDGEEQHLMDLAAFVNRRVSDLVAQVGQVGEARLLLMSALLIADELQLSYSEIDERKRREQDAETGRSRRLALLEQLAQRAERIAAEAEQA